MLQTTCTNTPAWHVQPVNHQQHNFSYERVVSFVCVYEGATRKYRRHSNKAMQSDIGQNVEEKGPFTPSIKVTLRNFFGLK